MEASRIIFTKETKDKMNSNLTPKQRGKLRWEKLVNMYEDGRLQAIKSRRELAEAVGFTREQRDVGYSWVTNMITRGYMDEVHTGFDRNNKPEYQYFLTKKKPNYGPHNKRTLNKADKGIEANPAKITEPVVLSRASDINIEVKPQENAQITITRGDITVTMNNVEPETLVKIIMGVINGGRNVEDVTATC